MLPQRHRMTQKGRITNSDGRQTAHYYCKLERAANRPFQIETVTFTTAPDATTPSVLTTDIWYSGTHDHRIQTGKTTGMSDLEKIAVLKRYMHVYLRRTGWGAFRVYYINYPQPLHRKLVTKQ